MYPHLRCSLAAYLLISHFARRSFAAVDALTPPHGGDMPHVTARMRWLAFRRLHALIHNLVTLAALLDRKPVIPTVGRMSRQVDFHDRTHHAVLCIHALLTTGLPLHWAIWAGIMPFYSRDAAASCAQIALALWCITPECRRYWHQGEARLSPGVRRPLLAALRGIIACSSSALSHENAFVRITRCPMCVTSWTGLVHGARAAQTNAITIVFSLNLILTVGCANHMHQTPRNSLAHA